MSKAFSASSEMIMYFFPQSVYMVDYIDGFLYVEPSLHPWDEAYLIGMDDFSDVFLDSIFHYFIENICINGHDGN